MDRFNPTRRAVEQIINHVATGVDSDSTPKGMGLLIPSSDLQKEIDKIMEIIAQETKKAEVKAEIKLAHRFRDDSYRTPIDGKLGWWFTELYWNQLITELQESEGEGE